MTNADDEIDARLANVERQLRRYRMGTSGAFFLVVLAGLIGWAGSQQEAVLRARALIIEDAEGQERVILGAPVPDPREGRRLSPATGFVINDGSGYERFGVGLSDDGNMVMGLDAPPGIDSGRNRERITMAANSEGGAEFRMLGHDSRVRAHMTLFRDNTVALFFTEYEPDRTIVHRVSAKGDTVVVHER
jgi:hypothetical protein